MSDEIKERRAVLRAELEQWIVARIPEFCAQLGGPVPELPLIEDFRLLICLTDGADADACDYYPVVASGTSHHRQVGLVAQAADYLVWRPDEDD